MMGRRGVGRPAARRAVRQTARRTTRRTMRRRMRRRRRRMLIGGMVLIGGSALVYKLSQNDAEKVEQYTGKPVDELSDEEMQQAMNNLGIQNQGLTAQEQAALDAAGDEYDEEEYEDEGGGADYLDELERLAELKDKGILTEEEFAAKKKDLLGL